MIRSQNRWSRRVIASLAGLLLLTAPVAAQEKLQPLGGGIANATEPVVVVTLGSIDKLMQDVNYLSGAVGQAQAGAMFGLMAGTFTQGIEPTQPIAIVVPLVDGAPQPIALIPTSDIKPVLKRLEAQTGPTDELDDGTHVIIMGANTLFIRQAGNWAVLAPKRELLDLAPSDPTGLFRGMGNEYDIAVRLKMQQVPAQTRQMLIAQLRQGFEQAMAKQNNGDAESGRAMAESSIEQIEQLINDTDELSFGFNVDQAGKKVMMDGGFTAVPGSKLAAMYGGTQAIPSQFASVIRDDAASFYHGATSIGPEAIEQTRNSLKTSLTAVEKAIENDDKLNVDQKAKVQELIRRVGDLAVESVAEGKADVGAMLLADENDFQFVFGAFVSDGNKAAQIVKDLANEVQNLPNAPRFKFDIGNYNGVNMHVVEADVPAGEDEARRVFGETLRVHVGTGPKAVYVAIGNKGESLMKELIDAGGSDNGGRPISQLQVKLLPILQFAHSIEPSDAIASMIDALSRAVDPGVLSVVQDAVENGMKGRLSMGEGLLQAIGAAGRQAQEAQMQGQF
ncbi:MAG: hypothetical protein AB8B91_03810 [Rubripirellula sp.]